MQLLVLGMHRSGTSMLTRLINLMGSYVGKEDILINFDEWNLKGYWERRDVVKVNEIILGIQDCTWDNTAGWDLFRSPDLPETLVHSMRTIILRMDAFRPWVMKDPRLCLTLPCWTSLMEVPVAVMMYRDPLEIACSLKKRDLLPGHSLALWEYHAVAALNASVGLPRLFVQYDRLLADPLRTLGNLFSELEANDVRGLRMPSEREIKAFVDPTLKRADAKDVAAEITLTPEQEEIAAVFRGERAQRQKFEISATSHQAMVLAKETKGQEQPHELM